jgi:hypothetical protein
MSLEVSSTSKVAAGSDEGKAATGTVFVGELLNAKLADFFYSLGKYTALKPGIVISVALVFTFILSGGAALLELETRLQYLYSPQQIEGFKAYERSVDLFGEPYREAALVIATKNGGSVLDKVCLQEALDLHLDLLGTDVGTDHNFEHVCVRTFPGGPCRVGNPMTIIWQDNATALAAMSQPAILGTVQAFAPHIPR